MSAPLKVSEIGGAPLAGLRIEPISIRRRLALSRIAEVIALPIVFAFSLEAACRIEDWVEFRTPLLARERSQEDLLVRDALGMHGRPGGHFQKWSLNAFGMRGPEVPLAKSADAVRVVTVGASETFGLYESPGLEYPRQLEDTLNAHLKRLPSACEQSHAQVLNAAMPGMSLPTIEQDVRLRISPLRPDFVVVYATPAAYLDDVLPVAARRDTTGAVLALPARFALHPRVADRIRVQIKSLLPTVIQDRIRREQIAAMLAEHPTRASGQTIVAFDSVARRATIAIARDSQAVVVDLTPVLARTSGSAFADFSHFTDSGAALTAETASRSILTALRTNTRCQ